MTHSRERFWIGLSVLGYCRSMADSVEKDLLPPETEKAHSKVTATQ